MSRPLLVAILAGTCGYSPPPMSTHVGAPGNVSSTQSEVHVSGGWAAVQAAHGTAGGSIPIENGLRLELGSGVAGAVDSEVGWLLGRVGLRYSGRVDRDAAYDVELGGAGGVGGNCVGNDPAICDPADPFDLYDRPAGGAYAGFGAAHWIDEHAVFVRARTQLGVAANAPVTFFGTIVAGVDLRIDVLRVHLAGGGWIAATEHWSTGYFLVELGVTIPIGDAAAPRPVRGPPSEQLGDPG